MDNRKNIILALASIVVVIVLVWIAASKFDSGVSKTDVNQSANSDSNNSAAENSAAPIQEPDKPITREALAAPVKVPEQGEDVSGDVAVPKEVSLIRPDTNSSRRVFDISVEKGKFVPSEIIVKYKDTLAINLTATDGNYDFTLPDYGMFTALPKGQTKSIQMDATAPGKFLFYCKSCGGPESGPVGTLVISP